MAFELEDLELWLAAAFRAMRRAGLQGRQLRVAQWQALEVSRGHSGNECEERAADTEALERVLRGLGLDVKAAGKDTPSFKTGDSSPMTPPRVVEADLRLLAGESDLGGELVFFPRLRDVVRRELDGSPKVLRFSGLRDCVKQLTGAKRWSADCQSLNDQIVDYLRNSLRSEQSGSNCAMVVC